MNQVMEFNLRLDPRRMELAYAYYFGWCSARCGITSIETLRDAWQRSLEYAAMHHDRGWIAQQYPVPMPTEIPQ